MANRGRIYIVLHDRVGYLQERSVLSLGLTVKSIPTQLLEGELLEAFPESEQPNDSTRIALAGIERKNLRLECYTGDTARLTDKDADLLLGISSAGWRYQTYIDRTRMNFGRQISPGSQVLVEVKGFPINYRELCGTLVNCLSFREPFLV